MAKDEEHDAGGGSDADRTVVVSVDHEDVDVWTADFGGGGAERPGEGRAAGRVRQSSHP